MSPSKLHATLVKAWQQPEHYYRYLIKGKPGSGKTSVIDQAARSLDMDVIYFIASMSEPTDVKGLPALVDGHARFLPYGDWEHAIHAKKPTVVFFDDLGQATPAMQAAIMQPMLNRHVNGSVISPLVQFVAATNDLGQMAGVSGLLEPVKSRLIIVEMETSVDDWSTWAVDNNMPATLIAFLRSFPGYLSDFKPTKSITNSPSPRGWEDVGRMHNSGMRDLELYAGAVGEGAAVQYFSYCMMHEHLPSLDAILLNPETAPLPPETIDVKGPDDKTHSYSGMAIYSAVAGGLARKANVKNLDRVITYLERMPKEFSVMSIREAHRLNSRIAACQAYVLWAVKHKYIINL